MKEEWWSGDEMPRARQPGSVPEDVLSVGLDNTGRHLHSLISGSGNVVIVSWEVIAVASISGEWLSCSVLSGRPGKVVDVCGERWMESTRRTL